MGLVREPEGIDLIVAPSTLTSKDKKAISNIIRLYKLTGKLPSKSGKAKQSAKKHTIKKRSVTKN